MEEKIRIYLVRFKDDTKIIGCKWTKQEAEKFVDFVADYNGIETNDIEIIQFEMPSMRLSFERLLDSNDVHPEDVWMYKNSAIIPQNQVPDSYKFIASVLDVPYSMDIVAEAFDVLEKDPRQVFMVLGIPLVKKGEQIAG